MANRLAAEKSPYLLQHAHNPVDWYAWGEEAFARARREDKPIFLSVGYSTCHWCHVMERESFENPAIAQLMNDLFVNVKVDREERPDVDRVYMAFVQATTGGGGWPMSVWLTPELEPFYGGTYFPPRDAHGRPGFPTVLQAVDRTWRDKRDDVRAQGKMILERLRELRGAVAERAELGEDTLDNGVKIFSRAYDREYAGFGNAPKFPRPVTLSFLYQQHARTGAAAPRDMATRTLLAMSRGGMYDHLGGGFHRYSVDRTWHVPHFEKMLYDQAQLTAALVEGWQLTGDEELARVARETAAYVLADLTDPATGGFWSAEDADSPESRDKGARRVEGAYYVFTHDELRQALGKEMTAPLSYHFGCEADGNAEDPHGELTGKNVLHVMHTVEETAAFWGRPVAETEAMLETACATLATYRSGRVRPHLDDKVLTAWNGLMIQALARGGRALGEPAWVDAAARAARFVMATLWDAKTRELRRRWRAGEAAFEAHLEDHAALALALIELYEATFDGRWLKDAEALVDVMNEKFADPAGGWFDTSGADPSVLLRSKDDYDGAEPAGASLAALACLRLGEHRDRPELAARVQGALDAMSARLAEQPHGAPLLLQALAWQLDGPTHVVIAGAPDDPRTAALLGAVVRRYVPHRVLVLAEAPEAPAWARALPRVGGAPAAYVCRQRTCDRPITDPLELASRWAIARHE